MYTNLGTVAEYAFVTKFLDFEQEFLKIIEGYP